MSKNSKNSSQKTKTESRTSTSISDLIKNTEGPSKRGPYSFSRLNSCPLEFKFKYIDKKKGTQLTRFGTNIGSAMHDLAEMDVQNREKASVEEIVHHYLEMHPEYQEFIGPLTDQLHMFRENFFISKSDYVDSEQTLGVDFHMNYVDYDSPDCWYRGRCDYLEVDVGGVARIIDYKNYPGLHSNDALNDIYQGVGCQLLGYAAMIMAMAPDIQAAYIGVYYFRFGVTRGPMVEGEPRLFTREEVEAWWEHMQRKMLLFERRTTFPAVPDQKTCQYCSYVQDCDWQQSRHSGEILATSDDDARNLASRLIVLQEEQERIKGVLSTYTKKFGPLELDSGKVFGPTVYEQTNVDVKRVFELCKDVDLVPFITINKTSAGRLAKLVDISEAVTTIKKSRMKLS